jgi:hypothetical protein
MLLVTCEGVLGWAVRENATASLIDYLTRLSEDFRSGRIRVRIWFSVAIVRGVEKNEVAVLQIGDGVMTVS